LTQKHLTTHSVMEIEQLSLIVLGISGTEE